MYISEYSKYMISSPVAFRFELEAGGGEGGALGGDAAAAPAGAELRGGDEREAAAAGEEALGGAFGLQTGALGVSFRCRFGAVWMGRGAVEPRR